MHQNRPIEEPSEFTSFSGYFPLKPGCPGDRSA